MTFGGFDVGVCGYQTCSVQPLVNKQKPIGFWAELNSLVHPTQALSHFGMVPQSVTQVYLNANEQKCHHISKM